MSIVLPCRNEVRFIDACLASIFTQDLDDLSIEVIVVDGMSSDGTRDRLSAWQEREPRLQVLDNPLRIVSPALNLGIRAASAPFVVRMDVHCVYPKDYLTQCWHTLHRVQAENVGGVFCTELRGEGLSARLVQAISTHAFGVGGAKFRLSPPEGYVDTVPYGCFRKEIFSKIGMFDERLVRNQDYEFNRRLIASGGRVWLNPAIRITYFNQARLWGLFHQAWFTGKWNVWTWWVAPHAFQLRHAVPGFFLLFLVLGLLAGRTILPNASAVQAILGLYGLLAFMAAAQQSIRYRNFLLLPFLPATFFIYHLSYGIGIWQGLLMLLAGFSPVGSNTSPWPEADSFRIRLHRILEPSTGTHHAPHH